jgi:hypothetical protein
MALTKVTYSMIVGAPVNVFDFGAKGDGTTNDTAAIQAAIAYANALGNATIVFPASSLGYVCNSGLVIDPTITSIVGNGSAINFTGLTTGYALTLSPATTAATRNIKTFVHSISGLFFNGPGLTVTAAAGININDTSGSNLNSGAVFRDCSFVNFATDVNFGNGAFCTLFDHCNFTITGGTATTYSLIFPLASVNAGERNVFQNCMWNNRDFVFDHANTNGNTFFNSCSFDYSATKVGVITGGHVYINGGHIEQSSDAGYWFSVSGVNSSLGLIGCDISVMAAKASYAPFYCDSTTTAGGVMIESINLNVASTFTPYLVAGTGHTKIGKIIQQDSAVKPAISANQNVLAYGGFESANYTAEWTLASGAVRSATVARTGTYSLSLPSSSGVTPSAFALIPCQAGQTVNGEYWYQVPAITGTTGSFYTQVDYLDKGGNVISNAYGVTLSAVNVSTWTQVRIGLPPSPAGTVTVKLFFSIFGTASGAPIAYIDDVNMVAI